MSGVGREIGQINWKRDRNEVASVADIAFSFIWLYIINSIPARPLPFFKASPNVAGFSFLGLT